MFCGHSGYVGNRVSAGAARLLDLFGMLVSRQPEVFWAEVATVS